MEEDGDNLDDLFEEYESNDPQPQENVNNENAENEAAVPEKVAVPKRVLKPRLKFNPERLCGKKGIPVLVDHFKDVKFKGKGYEKEDLKKLLTTMELWTHRLFPSMKFEDCLRQIEHLGKKRPVKTCVQKIRNDMPILDKDFVRNEDDDEEEEEQEQPNELEPEPPVQDAFDRLFDDYRESAQPVITSTPSSSQSVGNVLGTSFGAVMSEEQKKRMEYNKMLAIERQRKARLSAMQSSSLVNATHSENTSNVESALNVQPTEKDNDENFLFDYLQKQFRNTENSSANEKREGRSSQSMQLKTSEMVESVDEGDRDETDHDVLPNIRNNDCLEGNGEEELGLDELMDLVDEGERDETNQNMSCLTNNDESDKYETVSDALSNVGNNVCSESSGKVELELDELMDLVDEGDKDETDVDKICAKNNDKDENYHDALSNVKSNDYSKDNSKKELGFDESMDLLEEDHQGKKGYNEQTNETDAGFQEQHTERTDDEL